MLRCSLSATFPLALAALLCTSACGQRSTDLGAAAIAPSAMGRVAMVPDGLQGVAGAYRLQVDPDTLTGSFAMVGDRAASANDDLYLLPLTGFLKPNSIRVTAITNSPTTLDVEYEFLHPFAAPTNPAGTASASNRADLGLAAFALFLADVPSPTGNTYFTDAVANTTLIAGADAYWQPGGLLTGTYVANTFPYLQLADDRSSTGNRVGISNAGAPTGNYGDDGWTRTELGLTKDQWTGFSILHQGQRARRTLLLNKTELSLGTINLDLLIVCKYNDPRQGSSAALKKINRLPPAMPDITKFDYRMPHGALDVSSIDYTGQVGDFFANEISASTLGFTIVDWDANADETTLADLSLDPDRTHVAMQESGAPLLELSIPGVLGPGIAASLGLSSVDASGQPDDPLIYSGSVTKPAVGGQVAGTHTGLARATDPEAAFPTPLVFTVDANLQALTVNVPVPVTYQRFEVTMVNPTGPPICPNGALSLTDATDSPSISPGEKVRVHFAWSGSPDPDTPAAQVGVLAQFDLNGNGMYTDDSVLGNATMTSLTSTANVSATGCGMVGVRLTINDESVTLPACSPPLTASTSLPSVGNLTLTTLTTGSVPRTGTAGPQPITGMRLGWTDITGEAGYAIYRAELLPGASLPLPGAFTFIAEVAANTITYTHVLPVLDVQGHRYIYRVNPRCVAGQGAGGANGEASQFAIVALQDWEGPPAAVTNVINSAVNGWVIRGECGACGGEIDVNFAGPGLTGAQSLRSRQLSNVAGTTDRWGFVHPPELTASDWATLLPTFSVSRFEFDQVRTGTYSNGGTMVIATNTPPVANATIANGPDNLWVPDTAFAGTTTYDTTSTFGTGDDIEWGVNTQHPTTTPFHFRNIAATPLFSAANTSAQTLTQNRRYILLAMGNRSNFQPNHFYDNMAWVLY